MGNSLLEKYEKNLKDPFLVAMKHIGVMVLAPYLYRPVNTQGMT